MLSYIMFNKIESKVYIINISECKIMNCQLGKTVSKTDCAKYLL